MAKEGDAGAAEVVQRHGFAEGTLSAAADGVIDGAIANCLAALANPKRVVGVAADEDRSNLIQVAHQIRLDEFRHGPALGAPGFGVLGIEQDVGTVLAELHMRKREGGEAAAADRLKTEECDDQAVAELDLRPLASVDRRRLRGVHKRNPEVERLMRRYQPLEAILRGGESLKACLQRLQPAPVTVGGDEAGAVVELRHRGRRRRRRRHRHAGGEVVGVVADALGGDPIGGGDIFDDNRGAGAHLCAGSRYTIIFGWRRWLGFLAEHHARDLALPVGEGGVEEGTILRRPRLHRQVLQAAGSSHYGFLPPNGALGLLGFLRLRRCSSSVRLRSSTCSP